MSRFAWAGVLLYAVGCHLPTQPLSASFSAQGDTEALAGAKVAPAVEARFGGVVQDPIAEQRMTLIAHQLAKASLELHAPFRCRLLASNQTNAVSLPGGRIYLTQGLYHKLSDDASIAAVLAHEMAHIIAKDHFKPRCRNLDDALARELAADKKGAVYLEAAGFSPQALIAPIGLIRSIQPSGWADIRIANLSNNSVGSDIQLTYFNHTH